MINSAFNPLQPFPPQNLPPKSLKSSLTLPSYQPDSPKENGSHSPLRDPHLIHSANSKRPLEIRDENGQTELFKAAQEMDYQKVKKLLKQGFDPNSTDNKGDTPLLAAIEHFYASAVISAAGIIRVPKESYLLIEILLSFGANPHHKGSEGHTAFDKAIFQFNPDILRRLATAKKCAPLFTKDGISQFSLSQNKNFVSVCLDLFKECDFIAEDNHTLLHELAKNGDLEGIHYLAEKHPTHFSRWLTCFSKRVYNEKSVTPLYLAVNNSFYRNPHFLVAEFLLKKGAEISTLNDMLFDHLLPEDILDWLIKQHIDINAQDEKGNTILHHHLLWRSPSLIKLLEAGAHLTIKNKENETPIDLAKFRDKKTLETMSWSKQAISIERPVLHQAALEKNLEKFTLLLETEDLQEKDTFLISIAEILIRTGQLEMLKLLSKKVVLLETYPYPEYSLLSLAIEIGNKPVCDFLLECGFGEELKKRSYIAKSNLLTAIEHQFTEIIGWFNNNFPVSSEIWNDELILKAALKHGYENIINRCFDHAHLRLSKKNFLENQSLLQDLLKISLEQKNTEFALQFLDLIDATRRLGNGQRNSIYHLAIDRGDKIFFDKLLEKFPPRVLRKYNNDEIPFDYAVKKGNIEFAEKLFYKAKEKIVKKTLSNEEKVCIFQQAICLGVPHHVKELLEHPQLSIFIDTPMEKLGYDTDFFSYAAYLGKSEIVKIFLEKQFPIQMPMYTVSRLPKDKVLFFALLSKNPTTVQILINAYEAQNKEPYYENLFETLFDKRNENHSVTLLGKKICLGTSREVEEMLWYTYLSAFSGDLQEQEKIHLIERILQIPKNLSPFFIVKSGLTMHPTLDALIAYLQQVSSFCGSLENHFKGQYIGDSSKASTELETMVQQIFRHIFLGMNPSLIYEDQIFSKMESLIKKVENPSDYDILLTALQVSPDCTLVEEAFDCAVYIARNEIIPSKALLLLSEGLIIQINEIDHSFLSQEEKLEQVKKSLTKSALTKEEQESLLTFFSKSGSFDVLTLQKKWFSFVSIYRSRQGLSDCHYVLRNRENFKNLLPYVLRALESISISRLSEKLDNKQIPLLMDIIENSETDVKILAIKALSLLVSHKNHQETIRFLKEKLQESPSREIKIAVIQALDKIQKELFNTKQCGAIVYELASDEDLEVRWQAALMLSGIPDEKCLLKALSIIHDPAASGLFDKHYGANRKSTLGDFNTFRSRPHYIHDNRAALIERIQYNLSFLYRNDPLIQEKVEAIYENFKKDPTTNRELYLLKQELEKMMKAHIRYLHVPLVFPQGTALIRGLSARKGVTSFQESIVDFIRKGSGTAALTDFEAQTDGGTWKKIGHAFASHNKDLFFKENEGCTYFSTNKKEGVVSDSALIIFPSDYYEREAFRGQARMELEGTYNNVLYQGIPKSWTTALYLPESFRQDIEALSSKEPIAEITLTQDTFKELSPKELVRLRRHLQALVIDQTGKEERVIPFSSKIRFFPQGNAQEVEKILAADGVQFVTEENIHEETLKAKIRVEVVSEMFQEKRGDPYLFYTPEKFLTALGAEEFAKNYPLFRERLPLSISCVLPPINENLDIIKLKSLEKLHIEKHGVPKGRAIARLSTLWDLFLEQHKEVSMVDILKSLMFNPAFFGLPRLISVKGAL